MNNAPDSNSKERLQRQTQMTETNSTGYNDLGIESQTYKLTQQGGHLLTTSEQRSLTLYNHITYLLYVLSYFTAGLLWIVPIVMNYAKRRDADNTWLATHFDWQIKTFWYSIVLFVIGMIIITFALGGLGVSVFADSGSLALSSILLTGLGLLIMAFTFIWHLYRIVRGWVALTDNRPVP
ncbi:DUF4870 family protein [uncultured Psychrobacter sp.]|uniref:DUF4870 family protein n=1 Tax=uncultured Psychrobacter sp. TaxID=259303 RepID=UPI003458DF89